MIGGFKQKTTILHSNDERVGSIESVLANLILIWNGFRALLWFQRQKTHEIHTKRVCSFLCVFCQALFGFGEKKIHYKFEYRLISSETWIVVDDSVEKLSIVDNWLHCCMKKPIKFVIDRHVVAHNGNSDRFQVKLDLETRLLQNMKSHKNMAIKKS